MGRGTERGPPHASSAIKSPLSFPTQWFRSNLEVTFLPDLLLQSAYIHALSLVKLTYHLIAPQAVRRANLGEGKYGPCASPSVGRGGKLRREDSR